MGSDGYLLNKNVSQVLLEYLKLEGVQRIFGVPGGALIYLLDELKKQSEHFDFIVCRHETGAAYMADGYSRVTGGLGVVLTTSGPSATNAVTGAMNAQTSNSSVLVLTGEVARKYFGQGYLQEGTDARLDVAVMYRNAVQYSQMITDQSNFQTLFEQALREARSLPKRTTHISLPVDVSASCIVPNPDPERKENKIPFPTSPSAYRVLPGGTNAGKVEAALHELTGARRPLIFLGNGARDSLASPSRIDAFERFVDRFGIPVMTTPDAKGIFPESHELSLRNYGMTACSWPELYMCPAGSADHYDALIVMGSTLGELATSVVASEHYSPILTPDNAFIQVDLDQSVIGREFPITSGIVGEIGATIDELCRLGDEHKPDPTSVATRKELIHKIKGEKSPFGDPAGRDRNTAPLHPAAMIRVINEVVDSGHILIDAGNCVGWSLNNFVIDPPLRYHSALIMGPMGFGVAAVVGAKIGDPEATCIAVVGDGAFMMHGNEISTAAQNGVGAIWVVLYDNDLAMVSQGMGELFKPPGPWFDYYKLGSPDLVKFSEGLGADAVSVRHDQGATEMRTALETAIRQAEQGRPQVIVVHIDTAPMPPYGWPNLPPIDCKPPSS